MINLILPFIYTEPVKVVEPVKIESHIVVPFYSQFSDIESVEMKKNSCGIASLAMIINYYKPDTVIPQNLLMEGLRSGAFAPSAGWSHQGLINLAEKYGLEGEAYYYTDLSSVDALNKLRGAVKEGPVITSVRYKFEPDNPIPHLVVITNIEGDKIFYNDPAADGGDKEISTEKFLKSWKKRFITIRLPKSEDLKS